MSYENQSQWPRVGVMKRPSTRRLLNAFTPVAGSELEPLEPRVMMAATPIDANDQIREAVVAGVMSTTRVISGTMDATTDVDMISFDVSTGQTISMDVDRRSGTLDSYLRLFNSLGEQIAFNDNAAAPGEAAGKDSYLTYTFSTGGRYYVAVSASGNTGYSAITGLGDVPGKGKGTYKLTLSKVDGPTDTAGNTLADARNLGTISSGYTLSEALTTSDHDDFFKFSVTSAMNATINLSGLSSNADLQFIADANGNGVADPGEVLASGALTGTGTKAMQKSLTAGTYYVRVYNNGSNTGYALSLSLTAPAPAPTPAPEPTPTPTPTPTPAPEPGTDWFSSNLFDSGIVTVARSLFTDGSFNRGDMINILATAGSDDGVVDANELADLRKIVASASTFGMADYVKVLAGKIVNGSVANATYLGSSLGNLAAGSSAAHLGKLVDKWFRGADHPVAKSPGGATYTYQYVAGSLFQNGIAYTDIRQGTVGDCYLLATMGSIALNSPSSIQNMIIDNGDQTYTIRFYNNSVADFVTVDRYLPVDSGGRLIFANMGAAYTNAGNELWVPLIEKAYAQANEMKWLGQDGTNSYQGISGGWMGTVYTQMLNRPSSTQMISTESALTTMLSSGKMITAGSKSSGTTNGVIANHAYIITGYNSTTKTFSLYNPWGTNQPPALTFTQLMANFNYTAAA